MKILSLFLSMVFIIFLGACKNDDDNYVCVQTDWVGVYTGTQVCNNFSQDVTVDITASGTEDILVKFATSDGAGAEFLPLTPNGCDMDISEDSGGLILKVDAVLDGNKLRFNYAFSSGATSTACLVTATRN